MNKNLTCNQVNALLNYYINGLLNPSIKIIIDKHLKDCPTCRKKITELQSIKNNKDDKMSQSNSVADREENKELIKTLSAYIDNELNPDENIKIKKITVANPTVREKLESMYKFKKLLHAAYEKTKSEINTDYSRYIISAITETNGYSTTYFKKLIILFIIIMITVIVGFIYLYF